MLKPSANVKLDCKFKNTTKVITMDRLFASYLKQHQREGLAFCLERMLQEKGCILAHYMGLGKTLTALAFIHCCFQQLRFKRCLLVVPKSLIENWVAEYKYWVKNDIVKNPFSLYVLRNKNDLRKIPQWHEKTNTVLMCTPHRLVSISKLVRYIYTYCCKG